MERTVRWSAGMLLLTAIAAERMIAQQSPPRQEEVRRLPKPAFQPEPQRRQLTAAATGGRCAFIPIDASKWGQQPFRNPPDIRASGGVLRTTLAVQLTDPRTTSVAGCPVRLRSYNGALVGPTLRVKPGDVLAPLLANRLPRETDAQKEAQFKQENGNAFLVMRPYSFNTTNLHTHGLHVSPQGNSDNVLLAIAPQDSLRYRIALPGDHTRGTYWYHAHTHGSTAIQVGSGMAGALIVEDDSLKIPPSLRAANRGEKIMVFETILYDTSGRAENIASFFPDPPFATDTICQTGNSGCTWQNSQRRTLINGQIMPIIRMRPGEVQRWRLIDAAFRENLQLRLEGHTLHEIALDGIYTGRVDSWRPLQSVLLGPGYRSDVLIKANSRAGRYVLFDDTSSATPGLRGVSEPTDTLAIVEVSGQPMEMTLPTNAEMAMLNPFPGVDLTTRADQVQETLFKLGGSMDAKDGRNSFQVNYAAFDDSRVHYVQLNNTDLWSVTTVGDPPGVPSGIPPLPHVFHIHVNPFQVYRTDPLGNQQLVWKDTQLIPGGARINLFTRYLDYTGKFVLHCHILDHEDLGMMEVVDVVKELPMPHPKSAGQPMRGMQHGVP